MSRPALWLRWTGPAISAALLCAVVYQLRSLDFSTVVALFPRSFAFWAVFAISYATMPFAELIIFRKLWRIPWSGIIPLARKMIGNELLLGYIGEVYFYTWARRRSELTAAPFGAVKDVAILSALTGNAVTIVLLAIAYPLLQNLQFGIETRALYLSLGVLLATSFIPILFRRRLFSLSRGELGFIAVVHLIRITGKLFLGALLWHVVLPNVALFWWLLLATLRQLLSRLPFLPNKDIAFAGLAVFLIGRELEIGALITMITTITLVTHLVVGAMLAAADLRPGKAE